MAEVQKEYQDWAARKAGKDEEPQGQQDGGEVDGENPDGGEPPPPAHECLTNAAQEVTEAIEMLEKAKGQVEEPDDIQTIIDDLTAQEQAMTEKAKELQELADEEDDGEVTPEPEAV